MGFAVFETATGKPLRFSRDAISFDSETETRVKLSRAPDLKRQRWDSGKGALRDATAQEIADQESAELKEQATAKADANDPDGKYLKAFAYVMLREVNRLRDAAVPPLPPVSMSQFVNAVKKAIRDGDV